MKKINFTSLIIITLIVLSFSSPIYAYKVEAYTWFTKNYMFNINPIGVNDSVDYSGKSGTIISAINNWDAVNTSNFTSTSAGTTTETGWGEDDDKNVITWRGPSQFSGSVIGMASIWYSGSNILDADIKLNTSFVNDSRMPLLVMHESGHAIGIEHTKEQGESATTEEDQAVMHWELDSQTAPNCQDNCAVTALYPKSVSCHPNDTPGTYLNCIPCCGGANTAPTAEISSVSPNPAIVEQTITVEAIGSDEDGDKVRLKIDWDDEEVSSYSSLQTSDSTFSFTHTYLTSGTFDIMVKPIDSNGKEGKWSDPASLTLNVDGSGGTSVPFGEFATPTHNSTVRSSIPVTGWVLDDIGVESVKIYRGETNNLVYIGDAIFVEGARPDVEQAYPGYPMNYRAGWGYMMLTNFLPGGDGTFVIQAIATDIEGNQVTLGIRAITVDNASAVKPFGAIDTPAQGGTASGSSFINWGWVLTPQPNNIPTDGSTINVWVDGINLGHPSYNRSREDIATKFPGYANTDGAVGLFYLDTTTYENGVHTIQWTAKDNASNSDGIGSRYFSIQNTDSNSTSKVNSQAVFNNMHKIMKLPIDNSVPVKVKSGFNENVESRIITSGEKGISRIELRELERIEIQLSDGASNIYGYIVSGTQLRPLPIGSTLEARTGKFLWQPGLGFVGEYSFVFIVKDNCGNLTRKNLIVNIIPKF